MCHLPAINLCPRLNIFCLFRESVALFHIAWRVMTAVNNYPGAQIINLQSHHCFLRARRQIWTEMNLLNSQTVLRFLSLNLSSHLQLINVRLLFGRREGWNKKENDDRHFCCSASATLLHAARVLNQHNGPAITSSVENHSEQVFKSASKSHQSGFGEKSTPLWCLAVDFLICDSWEIWAICSKSFSRMWRKSGFVAFFFIFFYKSQYCWWEKVNN